MVGTEVYGRLSKLVKDPHNAKILKQVAADEKHHANIFKKYSKMQKKNFEENINPVLEILASFCRDMIVMKLGSGDRFLINLDYKHKLSELEEIMDLEQSVDFLRVIEESLRLLQQNANRRAVMNSMTINLVNLMERENV